MNRVGIAALCAMLVGAAAAARAYESKDIEDVPRTAPGSPEAAAPEKAPEGNATPGEPTGIPTQDAWARNEVSVLVTARVVDAMRGYPLDRARVMVRRAGGPSHEIARTDVTGGVHARYRLHDPPPTLKGAGSAVSSGVVVRVERAGYLPYEGSFGPGSLPRKGSYAWIDLGDLRMRAAPKEPESK